MIVDVNGKDLFGIDPEVAAVDKHIRESLEREWRRAMSIIYATQLQLVVEPSK